MPPRCSGKGAPVVGCPCPFCAAVVPKIAPVLNPPQVTAAVAAYKGALTDGLPT